MEDAYTGMLNATQLAVLRWIDAGRPDGVMTGHSHRVTATALKTRRLATSRGSGASWSAEITPRGKEYLDRLAKHERAAKQLVSEVAAAGGALWVPMRLRAEDVDYEHLVADAHRLSKVPVRTKLTIERHYGRGELEIRLVEAADPSTIELTPVPVSERVARPHRVAQQFRDNTADHRVSRAQLSRCTRIVHAIATEAERRGYEVAYHGHPTITIRQHAYRLELSEEKVPLRGVWDAETHRRAAVNYPQYLPPRKMRNYDSQATGRLTITIDHGYGRAGHAGSFSDRTRWTLEDKLPNMFRELELRATEADVAAREAERRADERQQRWELEIARAREQLLESKRVNTLHEQTRSWLDARSIRGYIAALEEAQGTRPEAQEWIHWAHAYADRLDPVQALQCIPTMPEEIAPDELKPFLPTGVSPHGPRQW